MSTSKNDLMKMSQVELDAVYKTSPVGAIPDGESQGTAIIFPDTPIKEGLSQLVQWLAWQGKIFYRERGTMVNKVTLFSIAAVEAKVYSGESLLCPGEDATILDYSQSIFLAQPIRDEIREVQPGLYLGNAYWDKIRVLNFILEF